MHALGMSILLSMSSSSFAELIMDASGGTGQAALNWSSEDAKQLLNGDVDNVNARLHHAGDLLSNLDRQRSSFPVGIGFHTEQLSNRFVMTIQRG